MKPPPGTEADAGLNRHKRESWSDQGGLPGGGKEQYSGANTHSTGELEEWGVVIPWNNLRGVQMRQKFNVVRVSFQRSSRGDKGLSGMIWKSACKGFPWGHFLPESRNIEKFCFYILKSQIQAVTQKHSKWGLFVSSLKTLPARGERVLYSVASGLSGCELPPTCGRRSIVLSAPLRLLQPFPRSKLQQVKSEFKEMMLIVLSRPN